MKVHAFLLRAGVAAVVVLLVAAGSVPVQARASYDGGLEDVLRQAEPDSMIPLLVLFNKPLSSSEVRLEIKGMSLPERRVHVVDRLKNHLQQVAARPIRWIEDEYVEGRAEDLQPLWIANGYVFKLRADRVEELAQLREVRTICYDRPISFEEATDEAPWTDPGDVELDEIGWGVEYMGATALWSLGYYGRGALVAVIDTGIDTDHTDLSGQLWTNEDEIPDNNIDDDGNGYIDDIHGWNFYDDNHDLDDVQGHGTKSAGVLVGNGTAGDTTGVAPHAKLMVIRNWNSGWSSEATHPLAVQYALDNGALVISCSMSYQHDFDAMDVTHRTTQEFSLLGGMIHANSMGNNGDGNEPLNINAPARCPHPWLPEEQTLIGGTAALMSIGAHTSGGQPYYYSTVGPTEWYENTYPDNYRDYPYEDGDQMGLMKPTVLAPASTPTTSWTGGYTTYTGESSATPHAAGALTLLRSIHPQATPEELCEAIIGSAEDVGEAGFDNESGAGLLKVHLAHDYLDNMFDYSSLQVLVTDTAGTVIEDARVVLGSNEITAFTDEDGYAVMPRVLPGTYEVFVIAAEFNPWMQSDVEFDENEQVELTAELEPSTPGGGILIQPEEVMETIQHGDTLEQNFLVTNLGEDAIELIPVVRSTLEMDWEMDGEILLPAHFADAVDLVGFTLRDSSVFLWGSHLTDNHHIWEVDHEGVVVDSFPMPEVFVDQEVVDLAPDGADGFYAALADTVYHMNALWEIDEALAVMVTDGGAYGLAFDPDLHRFYIGAGDSTVVMCDSMGAQIGVVPLLEIARTLTFNPDDETGECLYYQSLDNEPTSRVMRLNLHEAIWDTLVVLDETQQNPMVGLALDASFDTPYWSLVSLFNGAPVQLYSRELDHSAYAIEDTVTVYSLSSEQVPFEVFGPRIPPGSSHEWVLEWRDLYGEYVVETPIVLDVIQYVEDGPGESALPYATELLPPFPNPFNNQVQLTYRLAEAGEIHLAVFNVLGQKVAQLAQGRKPAGEYEAVWSGDGMATGVYVVVLQIGKERYAKKMTLIR